MDGREADQPPGPPRHDPRQRRVGPVTAAVAGRDDDRPADARRAGAPKISSEGGRRGPWVRETVALAGVAMAVDDHRAAPFGQPRAMERGPAFDADPAPM